MEVSNAKNMSYTELANAIRPERKGPLDGTYMENRLGKVQQQKYQYYDRTSPFRVSPYRDDGARNANFTSPSFLSNAVFYQTSKNLDINKSDMYRTTNILAHSHSCDRLQPPKRK